MAVIDGINLDSILDNEFRIGVMENFLDYVKENNENLKFPNKGEVDAIRLKVFREMKKRYPSLVWKKGGNHLNN